MAKKQKKRNEKNMERKERRSNYDASSKKIGFWGGLRDETRNSIVGILMFIVAVILLFSAMGNGGMLGGNVYDGIHFLFVLLGINFFRARERSFATPALVAGPFFILSALGLLAQMSVAYGTEGFGGFVGYYIMMPLVALFASTLTAIMLVTVLLIAVLILFDMPLHLGFMLSFWRMLRPTKRDELVGDEIDTSIDEEEGTTEVI